MEMHQVLRKPRVTEKGASVREAQNQYLFEVDKCANKHQVKSAIEQFFKVEVMDVRTLNVRGKIKRVGRSVGKQSNWKKAYVTLKKGQKIEFFENV